MPITLAALYRYPVKALSAESLDATRLTPGAPLPGDRRFALAVAGSAFDPFKPRWFARTSFVHLARHPRLALLSTHFNEDTGVLVIERKGRRVVRGNLTTPTGRAVVADFFAAFLKDPAVGTPRVVSAPGITFHDDPRGLIGVINAASLGDIARVGGQTVNPLRLRPNLVVDGAPAWAEGAWVGRTLVIGTVRLRVVEAIERTATTTAVNPGSGEVDLDLPQVLLKAYGRTTLGVHAEVVAGGPITVGEAIDVVDE